MAAPEKHGTFHEIKDALLGTKGCALCSLERTAIGRWFDSFLYEHVNDYGLRARLLESRGYCPRHAHRLLEFQDGLGIAILYKDQVSLLLEFLEKSGTARQRWSLKPRQAAGWQPGTGCPACSEEAAVRERFAVAFVEGLADPELRQAFEGSTGLCAPHVSTVLGHVRSAETRTYFLQSQRAKLEKLREELSEYVRKSDHECRNEAFGEEADSWNRAVRLLTGEPGAF